MLLHHEEEVLVSAQGLQGVLDVLLGLCVPIICVGQLVGLAVDLVWSSNELVLTGGKEVETRCEEFQGGAQIGDSHLELLILHLAKHTCGHEQKRARCMFRT